MDNKEIEKYNGYEIGQVLLIPWGSPILGEWEMGKNPHHRISVVVGGYKAPHTGYVGKSWGVIPL